MQICDKIEANLRITKLNLSKIGSINIYLTQNKSNIGNENKTEQNLKIFL